MAQLFHHKKATKMVNGTRGPSPMSVRTTIPSCSKYRSKQAIILNMPGIRHTYNRYSFELAILKYTFEQATF